MKLALFRLFERFSFGKYADRSVASEMAWYFDCYYPSNYLKTYVLLYLKSWKYKEIRGILRYSHMVTKKELELGRDLTEEEKDDIDKNIWWWEL